MDDMRRDPVIQGNMSNGLRYIASAACLAIAGGLGWYIAPDYIARPNKEANPSAYTDAAKVFNKTETREVGDESYSQTYTGSCPDLSVMTAKALLDRRLTVREVHDLREKAQDLYIKSGMITLRNEALEAAGQPLVVNPIHCDHGDELFG